MNRANYVPLLCITPATLAVKRYIAGKQCGEAVIELPQDAYTLRGLENYRKYGNPAGRTVEYERRTPPDFTPPDLRA